MKKILLIASLLATSMSVSAAHIVTGSSSGVFQNPQGPGVPTDVSGVGTNSLSWGDGAVIGKKCFFIFCSNVHSDPSSLTFNGGGFTGEVGDNVNVGHMSFENGTIENGTEATSVDFALTLDFTTPFSETSSFIYNFALENTLNPNGDSVILVNGGDPTKFFTYEGNDYFFSLLGFKVGSDVLDEIFVKELKDKTFKLVGQFTTLPSEVPLPAAVWLLGSGLMGFMAIRRKAKAQLAA